MIVQRALPRGEVSTRFFTKISNNLTHSFLYSLLVRRVAEDTRGARVAKFAGRVLLEVVDAVDTRKSVG